MLKEFKEFAMRGSVLDLAVGIVIGAAFGKIVTSVVNDILMPPIGLLLGGVDFSALFVNLSRGVFRSVAEARAAGAPTLNYGLFINTVLEFIIVSFAVFLVVRTANRMVPRPAEVVSVKECPYCRTSIPIAAARCPNCTSQLSG